MSADELAPLSPRQRQIAELIADGHINKAIAAKLGIEHSTIRNHIRQIAKRLKLDQSRDTRVQISRMVADEQQRPQKAA